MLLKAALGVLAVWLVGLLGLYDVGEFLHILLLVGLLLLLLGALKAHDAAARPDAHESEKPRRPTSVPGPYGSMI